MKNLSLSTILAAVYLVGMNGAFLAQWIITGNPDTMSWIGGNIVFAIGFGMGRALRNRMEPDE
jgi:hypothetical protein